MTSASDPPTGDRPPFSDWPRPLAFALSGAGAFGSVHVGMIRALQEAGVHPDVIVGTSAGALHGALLAARPDAAVEVLTDLWLGFDRRSVFGSRLGVVRNLWRHRTLSDLDRLAALIDDHLTVERFDGLSIGFAAVATDALTGEPELLSAGRIKPALLASAAVPGVFPPVDIDGRRYIDGGVAANVPIRQAIAFGARSVLSLDATPSTMATEFPAGFLARSLHTVSLMVRNQRSNAVDELAHRYPIAVLPSPTPPDMGSFNFAHTADLIAQSHRLTADHLATRSPRIGTTGGARPVPG